MAERSDLFGRVRWSAAALAVVLALAGGAFGRRPQQDEGRRQEADAAGFTYSLKRVAAEGSSFEGKVTDPNGAAIAGADVLLRARGKRGPYAGVTSDGGLFEVKGLAPGVYEVEIHSPGFKRFRLKRLEVGDGEAVLIELVLPVAPEPMPAPAVEKSADLSYK